MIQICERKLDQIKTNLLSAQHLWVLEPTLMSFFSFPSFPSLKTLVGFCSGLGVAKGLWQIGQSGRKSVDSLAHGNRELERV